MGVGCGGGITAGASRVLSIHRQSKPHIQMKTLVSTAL